MNKLLGRKTNMRCLYCGEHLYTNKNHDIWCRCGYSNDSELEDFIHNMKRITNHKKNQFNRKLTMAICFLLFWLSALGVWLLYTY